MGQDRWKFPITELKDGDGNVWHQEGGKLRRLNQGAEGAHLCSPFQCELCWFRNLEGKDPLPGVHNQAICLIGQSNLDNMDGRAPSTIRGHLMETLTLVQNFGKCGLTLPLQPLGPLPLSDSTGMGEAIGMQLKLITAKGQIVANPQYDTVQGV